METTAKHVAAHYRYCHQLSGKRFARQAEEATTNQLVTFRRAVQDRLQRPSILAGIKGHPDNQDVGRLWAIEAELRRRGE